MTDDEKRQQKAMLLLEYQEAEETLAHLREKARAVSLRISHVATWVENVGTGVHGIGTHLQMRESNVLSDPQIAIAMDFEAAKSLVHHVREAQKKLEALGERKSNFGLK